MGTEGFIRKITAIMSADVVGYSKLMADDEEATVQTLAVYKNVMTTLIHQHRGRVIDSPGDNMLSEFASVVDAVQCAVAIQKELKSRNAELAENRKMRFRIGVNLGDVIEEEERIYGDGVNIAARLESLADPGGICISKTAFDHIETKLPLGYECLGDQTVKNIPKPVCTYRVLMEPRVTKAVKVKEEEPKSYKREIIVGAITVFSLIIAASIWFLRPQLTESTIQTASEEKMAHPLPDKPSFVILPFVNMSNDPSINYLCDGIADVLIASFAKNPYLFVIARDSSFAYKDKTVKIRKISEDLGVQYVIEGSVQKSNDKLRVAVKIVDALTGNHILAESFEGTIDSIFNLQDQIALVILKAIKVQDWKLTTENINYAVGTDKLDAFLKLKEAEYNLQKGTEEDVFNAKLQAEYAIKFDPNYAMAYSVLAIAYQDLGRYYSKGESRKENFDNAIKFAQKAKELDDTRATPYILLGKSYLYNREYNRALIEFRKALEIDPTFSHTHSNMGLLFTFTYELDDAEYHLKEAIRHDPLLPSHYIRLGRVFFHQKRYDEAIKMHMKVIELMDQVPFTPRWPHLHLAMVYGESGRDEEARAHMKKVLELWPKFCIESRRRTLFFKDPATGERELAALRKAGAPEHPPSK